jgi:DNA-binding MurR/RpiR family transcriptional regulator
MAERTAAPRTSEELRSAILKRYDTLSDRLQQVARYVLDEPNDLALETLAVIAERSGVQPSAIVRFAKSFGFEGASQMQRLFRDDLLSAHPVAAYGERVREFMRGVDKKQDNLGGLLREFAEGNSLALSNLSNTVSEAELAAAVTMLEQADIVYVVGVRRAFPVAAYLAYSLQQAGKRTVFVDGVGGLSRQQLQTITSNDMLIGVSYQPYAEETRQAVTTASANGAKVLSITDSTVSPIAKSADTLLQVREAEIRGFRSLSASMCLAQALVIGFAFDSTRHAERRTRARRRSSTAATKQADPDATL